MKRLHPFGRPTDSDALLGHHRLNSLQPGCEHVHCRECGRATRKDVEDWATYRCRRCQGGEDA